MGRRWALLMIPALIVGLAGSAAATPGNGRAISNYLRDLKRGNASSRVLRREGARANDLGTLLYGSGWAEGTHRSGLGVALRHRLTFNEARAIQHWTKNRVCDLINPGLRAGRPVATEHRFLVETLASGLARLPGYGGTVYRGTSLPLSVAATLKPGTTFVDKGFQSTTKQRSIATTFMPVGKEGHQPTLFVFRSKQGKDISLVGWHGELREVLFPPGAELTVVSAKPENGVLVVHLRDRERR